MIIKTSIKGVEMQLKTAESLFSPKSIERGTNYVFEAEKWQSSYRKKVKGALAQGKSFKAQNGTCYNFLESSNDKTVTSKYGKASRVYYGISIYVVPADVAAKVGGKATSTGGISGYVKTHYIPSDASSGPVTCVIDTKATEMASGWYHLKYVNESEDQYIHVGINKKGYGEYGSQDFPNYCGKQRE